MKGATRARLLGIALVWILVLASQASASKGTGGGWFTDPRLSPFSEGPLHELVFGGEEQPTATGTLSSEPQTVGIVHNVRASRGPKPVNEVPIVANPATPTQLLTGGNDYNCPSIQGFYASADGGATWAPRHCMPRLPAYDGCGDPAVGYDLSGAAYVAGIDCGSLDWKIAFQKSTDGGKTWSAPAVAVEPILPGSLTDKEWLEVDTSPQSPHAGAVYISVTQFVAQLDTTISVTHSTDGGQTWKTVQVDDLQAFPLTVDQFSDLAVGADGTVYVSWMRCRPDGWPSGNCGGTAASVLMSKSTDGGDTWSDPVTVSTVHLAPDGCGCGFYGSLPGAPIRVSEIPVIVVDNSAGPNAGRLYVATYDWTGSKMQVDLATSSDGGATWGSPAPVAPVETTSDQFLPWISVSPTGTVGVTWMDRRDDPDNLKYTEYQATSTDGGATFTVQRLGLAISDPLKDGFDGSFLGDYTGNTWAGESLYASWPDTLSGVAQDEVGWIA